MVRCARANFASPVDVYLFCQLRRVSAKNFALYQPKSSTKEGSEKSIAFHATASAICCFAITLETTTPTPKGKTVRGRFYPPNSGWYEAGNAALSAGTNFGDNISGSGANLVTKLNTAGASIVVASQLGGGMNAPVTSISADNVIDTVRRRKNHAVGQRGTHSLPYTP